MGALSRITLPTNHGLRTPHEHRQPVLTGRTPDSYYDGGQRFPALRRVFAIYHLPRTLFSNGAATLEKTNAQSLRVTMELASYHRDQCKLTCQRERHGRECGE